jgi:hypothetical protein
MTPHDPTSLDPEERALAERLARLGPHGEPSPALDGRILAAAHGAMDGRRPASRRASRRWPLGLGVAASLALALGLAWQLRPLPDVAPAYRSEADSALRTAPVAASSANNASEPAPPPPADTAAADTVQREARIVDAQKPAARSNAEKVAVPAPQPAPVPAAPREAPIVFDAPAPTQAMQAAALPTPAKRAADASAATAQPSAANAPQAFGTTRAAADTGSSPSPSAERAMAPAAAIQSEPMRQKIAVPAAAPPVPPAPPAPSADEDMPIDDVPPATVASPQVRDAWLARIRELAADGNIEEARASLREFQHRYPDYPLPQDLRALLP